MTECNKSSDRRFSPPLLIAHGTVESSGLGWELTGNKRATNRDLRDVAALLIAAADRLESEPDAVDTRITA